MRAGILFTLSLLVALPATGPGAAAQAPADSGGDTGTAAARQLQAALADLDAGTTSGDRARLDAALAHFCRAAESRPGWWRAWYGIGASQLALHRQRVPVRPATCHTEGTSYVQDAGLAFARALAADSSRAEAALGLVEAIEEDRQWGLGTVARRALRRFGGSGAPQPARVLLLRALLERDGGDRALVAPLVRAYLAAGGDSGVGLLELAREEFLSNAPGATGTYWSGVERANSPRARALLRTQLAQIARPGELAPWDTLSPSSQPAWVRAFWTRRDVADGLAPGTRLQEHFRRLEVASRGFKLIGYGMAGDTLTAAYKYAQQYQRPALLPGADSGDAMAIDLWSEESLINGPEVASEGGFDGRGQMYLRHGPPDDMAGRFWLYRRNGQEYVVAVDWGSIGTPCDLSSRYCFYEMQGRRLPPEVRRRWVLEWGEMFRELSRHDSKPASFPRALRAQARFYALPPSASLAGGVVVAVAVPAADLVPGPGDPAGASRVRLQLVVAPPDGHDRFDLDTLRTIVLPPGAPSDAWVQLVEPLPLPPGHYLARLTLTSEGDMRGVTLAVDSLLVGDPATGPVLSDILLSRRASTLTWNRGGTELHLDPTGTVGRRDTLQLYYEVAGLPMGGAYRTSVELLRVSGSHEHTELSLTFTDVLESMVARTNRQLGIERVRPGNYVVQVTIDAEGRKLIRRSPVTVTKP